MDTFMRIILFTLLSAVYGTMVLCPSLSGRDIHQLLPSAQEFINWTQTDSVRIYSGEDLFTMINGGADIYIEYGFVQVAAVEYSNQSHSLTAEIYEMSDESSAFGIYSVSKSRNGIIFASDCEAQLNPMYILFYKERYFGIISSSDSAIISTKGMNDLYRIINKKIISSCVKPGLVNLLPKKGLKDIKLVHGYIGLSTITTFDTKDIFRSKQTVIGYYDSAAVYLFFYDSSKEAKTVFGSLQTDFKNNYRFSAFAGHEKNFKMKYLKQEIIYAEIINNTIVLVQTPRQNPVNHFFEVIKNLINR